MENHRDRGGPQQIAECWEGHCGLDFAQQYLDEIYLRHYVDEGWDAIWVVGCGPERCRRDEICNLPVEEWGSPHWAGETAFLAAEDSGDAPESEPVDCGWESF